MGQAPPVVAGAPGSFARSVFTERHPKLIEQVAGAHPYRPGERAALRQLLDVSLHGVLEPLPSGADDADRWRSWGAEWWGRSWGEAPFLFAESYFYRLLLDAVGYLRPGPWHGVDPFGPAKRAELTGPAVAAELRALESLAHAGGSDVREVLLKSALWGNQADLGFQLTASSTRESGSLLVDDSSRMWRVLEAAGDPVVHLVADNAGRELIPDLVLLDHLLTAGLAHRMVVHLKPRPYYVSDATTGDLLDCLSVLENSAVAAARDIGGRLSAALRSGGVGIDVHEFFCSPLPFEQMPRDLADQFAAADLVILKGDLNYRRLVGDRHWAPTTSFEDLVAYFPAPVAALRTLKSEVAVGMSGSQVDSLDRSDPNWRTNGQHAVIQIRPRSGGN
ncbi:damage-control phosphatase ARMT1 family protein [Nocardia stercoris]|uniref:Protein-glutamate O-methyltransferase family protein n=1 Tax=Nocardia stercoris TaxID=2483361 RepID=A0A3M2L1J2_9NOCA|nr:damage-control phosphatase ARMT1 family protein [Nocardia stercoris]RMI28418.1 protein-glutamate O-methyltransferase family protein [Nocardia stercoris]